MNYKTFDIFEGKRKKIDHTTPIDIFPSQFCSLWVGKPGSGKSHLLQLTLLSEMAFYKKFDLVLFFAPYDIAELKLKDDRRHHSLNLDWIRERIAYFKSKKSVKKLLIIIDDKISEIQKDQNNPELIDLFFNRRKLFEGVETSIIVTTQKYTMFPAKFRSSLQFIIFFNIPKDDYEKIASENLYTNQLSLKPILKAHFASYPHNFVYIRLDKYQVFLNFDKQI